MHAVAADHTCYQLSPNAVELGEAYYALDREIKLTDEAETALTQALKTLSGNWQGTLIETSCTGSDEAPKKEVIKLKTTANLSINSKDELRIEAQKHGYANDIERGETIILFNREGIYNFRSGDNAIISAEKIRLAANKASRLLETISHLSFNDDTLALTIDIYSNGVYVQTLEFLLDKQH